MNQCRKCSTQLSDPYESLKISWGYFTGKGSTTSQMSGIYHETTTTREFAIVGEASLKYCGTCIGSRIKVFSSFFQFRKKLYWFCIFFSIALMFSMFFLWDIMFLVFGFAILVYGASFFIDPIKPKSRKYHKFINEYQKKNFPELQVWDCDFQIIENGKVVYEDYLYSKSNKKSLSP